MSSRLTGFRFQIDATVENLQPMLDAVRKSLRGDRAHLLCHPCFIELNYEEGLKNMDWHTKVCFVHWSSWSFNKEGDRILTTLVSFTPHFSTSRRALIDWVERKDGSTAAFTAIFGSLKQLIQGMGVSTYKLYLKQTCFIPWQPTEFNLQRYKEALVEARKENNAELIAALCGILERIEIKMKEYALIQDENPAGETAIEAFEASQLPSFGFTYVARDGGWCGCEDYLCGKEADEETTPSVRIEGRKVIVGSGVRAKSFPIHPRLFHDLILHSVQVGYKTQRGSFTVGEWLYPYTISGTPEAPTYIFQRRERRSTVEDMNPAGSKPYDVLTEGALLAFALTIKEKGAYCGDFITRHLYTLEDDFVELQGGLGEKERIPVNPSLFETLLEKELAYVRQPLEAILKVGAWKYPVGYTIRNDGSRALTIFPRRDW